MRSKLLLFACLLALVFALTPARAQQFAAPRFTETVLRDAGGEPNVSISPSGKIVLVSGLGNDDPVTLYRSTDYGAHFTKLQPTFGSTGGGDWDMRFLDESTIIAADLGDGVHVDRSTDGGRTWSTTVVMEDTYDRPWIDHFGSDKVYLVAKGIADGFPYLYSSDDGGISFGDPPVPIIMYGAGIRPTETGGSTPTIIDVEASASNAYVDHLTVDPRTGDVYVLYGISGLNSFGALHPLGAENRLYVAHLEDGRMWSHPVLVGGAADSCYSGFNWMTVDQQGTIYVLANCSLDGRFSTRLSYSRDKGRSWSPLLDVGTLGGANVYGSIAAGRSGVLSLAYLHGVDANPTNKQDWFAETATILRANSPAPRVLHARAEQRAVHQKDICFDGIFCGLPGFGEDRSLLDYLWNAVDASGRVYAVIPSDGPASGGGDTDVIVLRQSGGGFIGRGAPS
ncbi:MAG: hypothetical protein ABR548_06925 [Actinomycetota bacterium]